MQHVLFQLMSQPWALPLLIGVGAFLLGLLIPSRNGPSWLSGIVLFLPYLFLNLLDMVHTKKFKYYGLVTALLAIEAFFAFRAATVYYDVLNSHMPVPEMVVVCIIFFVAIFLCGYMVATHGKLTFWSGCTMVFVIIHDWAGTIWMNYSQPILTATGAAATSATTAAASDQSGNDGLKVVLTIGMCVLGILPFIMGAWAEELRPQLEQELDQEVSTFTHTATRQIKRRAVNRVLRLANRTDIVRLVQALPADEFTPFKQFVMPIIAAPGTPYHLTQVTEDPASGQQGSGQPLHLPAAIGHNNTGQTATIPAVKAATGRNLQPANRPQGSPATGQPATNNRTGTTSQPATAPATGQQGSGHSGQPATNNRTATTGQNVGDQDKLDRTVAFLKANPQATDEDLAAHLDLSRPASALFYRRKAEEILRTSQQRAATQAAPLGWIERMMYDTISNLEPAEQAELRVEASSQSLAEFTHTLAQRYPRFAGQITEARVANVLAYDRQQQAATATSAPTSQPATIQTGQNSTTGHTPELDNVITLAGHHRTHRPTGQQQSQPAMSEPDTQPLAGQLQPDTGHEEPATGQQQSQPDSDTGHEEPATTTGQDSDPPDRKGRIAAYRATHPTATQKQVGEALSISERTVRRYWKQDEAVS